ncbi:MAG: DUF5666 domain-containing protein [Deltaproteobacteria bacterium]|nr:DUF5666 domain-containing protein [Deltaproteobacteria bacterium]
MKNNIIVAAVVAVVLAGGGFFAGIKYQESRQAAGAGSVARFKRQLNGNRASFRPVSGDILSLDDKSMTVKLQDGSSKIVLLSQTTTYSKSAEGSWNDLKVGEKVAAFGQENSDGSVTAQNVQINPTFRGGVENQVTGQGQNSGQ